MRASTATCAGSLLACAGLVASVVLVSPQAARAQAAPSASRVAPASAAPMRVESDGTIDLPETGTAGPPPGAQSLAIKVGGVIVEGSDSSLPPAAADAVATERAALAGRTVTIAELYAAAGRMAGAMARAGRVLTRVTLPPQHLSDGGAVRFLVVDGFVESIDVSQVPAPVREIVRRRLAGLTGVRGLTLGEIERHVLLAGDVPGVRLKTTLLRGEAVGATQLVVSGSYQPVSGSLGFENDLGSAYQYHAFTLQVALNSVLGQGEQIYATATSGQDVDTLFSGGPRRRILGIGAIVPLGNDGLTINPEYLRVDTHPRSGVGTTTIAGKFERVALRAAYPIIRGRRENLSLSASFEASDEVQSATGFGDISHDRLRTVALSAAYARSVGRAATLHAGGGVDFGLAGLGARKVADVLASGVDFSRQGSQPDYSKADLRLRLDSRIGGGFTLAAVVRAQLSFSGALPASAQFSIDGSEALSSFALGSLSADSGVTGRIELGRPFTLAEAGGAVLAPYGFVAAAHGHVDRPTIVELADRDGWAIGAGLRMQLNQGWHGLVPSAGVELSHGHVSAPAAAFAGAPDNEPTRVSVDFNLRF